MKHYHIEHLPEETAWLVYAEEYFRDAPLVCYASPELHEMIQPGSRVLIKIVGRKSKEVLGFVREVANGVSGAKPAAEIVDVFERGEPLFSPKLFGLIQWLANYYICRPIEALHAALPAELRVKPVEKVFLKPFELRSEPETIVKTDLRKRILSYLEKQSPLTVKQLQNRTQSKSLRLALTQLEAAGYIELKKSYARKGKPKLKTAYTLCKNFSEDEISSLKEDLQRAKKQAEVFERILAFEQKRFFKEELSASGQILDALCQRGILAKEKVDVSAQYRSVFRETSAKKPLTAAQEPVYEKIRAALQAAAFRTFLLHGVTGSGKTRIYIEAIRETLGAGKSALVLVPEISLTPQIAARFQAFFGDNLRVLHSAMNGSEKFEAWESLKTGKARVALGPRSAVFAPLENLGLVIVDEEHESSYKQFDKPPRYHARDTAIMRAKLEGAVCVLGSATPSFESYYNALSGKYELLTLSERADGAVAPEIKLVHFPKSAKKSQNLSQPLFEEIEKRHASGEQSILFLNRRGFAGSVRCEKCGFIAMCSDCHVPLVYHFQKAHLRCHYCGKVADTLHTCPKCGAKDLTLKSSGTERIEIELGQLFPPDDISRMDLDTTAGKDKHAEILKDFQTGKTKILLGTQMVAKGLDFPNVTLVGVINADIGLTLPDFRASERLFALLLQVAGRAGRGKKQGEVFMQVFNLESEVFRFVAKGDYEIFYNYEIESRKELFYPPFSRLAKIEFSGEEENEVASAAADFAKILIRDLDPESFDILGPAPAVMAKLKGRYRHQILIKQKGTTLISKKLFRKMQFEFRNESKFAAKVRLDIDVDTQSVM
ncbi:primosomal protein N' [Chloroherpeton thalassium ATCC 35110]|uniref:Replication restart protein PriA n=1 Tax=Chloroherpeton thalassium (strain ATCC 35110 / GB-78) TaxID=517418 RepID=B3QT54_CHLT3|nr:primosomal protein N' [Chloroherpeton thalassium]ACF14153.1 primosomal protein N' [Chloroherpeton thalassium ATCC 35110]